MIFNNVEYFPIPGFSGYFVSKFGDVYSSRSDSVIKQQTTKKGYKRVTLLVNDGKKTVGVHRLVLLAFVGHSNLECRHINSNPADNRIENLCYGTSAENTFDKFSQNRKFQKIRPCDAIDIARDKRPYKEIAMSFGISASSVSDIKCGLVWGSVTDGIRFQRYKSTSFKERILEKFSESDIRFILDKNNSREYISQKLSISIPAIKRIRHKLKSWF